MKLALPAGLAGGLAHIPLCAYESATRGQCSSDSQIGTVTVSAGGGPAPLSLPGKIYLARSASEDAVANFVIVVPAVTGPLDLGTVVSLAKLSVRSEDGGIDVTTEQMPAMIAGIPLTIRDLNLVVDRENFLTNATSCIAASVQATFTSNYGQTVSASAPYQPTNCAALPFKPTLAATINAPKHTVNAGLDSLITQKQGEANTKSVKVLLPAGVGVNLKSLEKVCPIAQYQVGNCAAAAKVGTVTAVTPLLAKPLTGPATFVAYPGENLPRLAIKLSGDITIPLEGKITTGDRLATTFDAIPDVPLTSFALSLRGGKDNALTLVKNMCTKSKKTIDATFLSHAGGTAKVSSQIHVKGCPQDLTTRYRRLNGSRPTLKATVRTHDSADANMTAVKLTLPAGLKTRGKPTRPRIAVLNRANRRIKGVKIKFSGRTVSITGLPKKGLSKLGVSFRAGSLRSYKKIRTAIRKKRKITTRATVTDAAGVHTKTSVSVKAK